MTAIHYRPWVGELYGKEGLFGKRVLVVGGWHYNEWEGERHEEAKEACFTTECVKEAMTGSGAPFWKTLFHMLGGPEFRDLGPGEFYRRIAFCNFIQFPIEGGPEAKPTVSQFRDPRNGSAFREVLEQLRPARAIVCSWTLWTRLPEAEEEMAHRLECNGHEFTICIYHLKDGAKVFATYFPGRCSYRLHEGLRRFIEMSDEELRALPGYAGR